MKIKLKFDNGVFICIYYLLVLELRNILKNHTKNNI